MRPPIKMWRALTLVATLSLLAGCSQYLARREGITASAGDALASDRVTMMVDPWPPASANKNIRFNGQRMQSAIARYRTNRVIPPEIDGTSGTYKGQQNSAPPPQEAVPKPVGPTVTQ